MSDKLPPKGAFSPKKVRRSIKLDRVNPRDFLYTNMTYCCEQCSYFAEKTDQCMLGYRTTPHRQIEQLKRFSTTSHMAFCRFLEID